MNMYLWGGIRGTGLFGWCNLCILLVLVCLRSTHICVCLCRVA